LSVVVADVLARACEGLKKVGVREPKLAARLLLQGATGWSHANLITQTREVLGTQTLRQFDGMVQRALAHEPIHYILGEREFYDRSFNVTPDVLIPRPETEILVEQSLAFLRGFACPSVLDIGTGSGVIAITIAAELEKAQVMATDISSSALVVAEQNAEKFGVQPRIEFMEGDLAAGSRGRFDLIVSNPPYVKAADFHELEIQVRLNEPKSALIGGTDGLDFYRAIFSLAPKFLKDTGAVAVEFGAGQCEQIKEITSKNGFDVIEVRKDLAGLDRTLLAYLEGHGPKA